MSKTGIKILICWCLILVQFVCYSQITSSQASEEINKPVTFCEILPNPNGSDTKDNEYFKLANSSSEVVSLEGWKACNISNDCYNLNEVVPANSCIKIPRTVFTFSLHNDKEELNLYDNAGLQVAKIATGIAPSGKAWQCYEENCAWGEPREGCDYSFLESEDDLPENDNTNSSDNTSESNDNGSESEENNNTNTSNIKSENNSYLINDIKDFSRLRKILRKEKLLSLLVNLKGIIAIPPGIMAKTYLYLSFKDQLIKAHIYSSCQNSPDCMRDIEIEQGKKLFIQNAAFKLIDGHFELFLDKNTRVTDEGKKKMNKTSEVINIRGTIVAKKGDYFFVENSKKTEINSIYISQSLQNAFIKKLDTVPLGYYPFYLPTIPSKSWIGGSIEVSGVVETISDEKRIIAFKLNKLQPADAKPEAKMSAEKAKGELKNAETDKPKTDLIEKDGVKNEKAEIIKPGREQIKTILAQSLSWKSLWDIIVSKLSTRLSSWRNYF